MPNPIFTVDGLLKLGRGTFLGPVALKYAADGRQQAAAGQTAAQRRRVGGETKSNFGSESPQPVDWAGPILQLGHWARVGSHWEIVTG